MDVTNLSNFMSMERARAEEGLDKVDIWIAELHSEHFTFRAIGKTEKAALRALQQGLQRHGRDRELEPGWYQLYGSNTYPMKFGMCRRDDFEI